MRRLVRIRHKLLYLLLVFAAIPLLLGTAVSHFLFYRSGSHLSSVTQQELSDQAHVALRQLVESYQLIYERDRRMMETALAIQNDFGSHADDKPSIPYSSPPLAFDTLQNYLPGTVSRQVTILETGSVSCYPSGGKCLGQEDAKKAPWYRNAKTHGGLTRSLVSDPVSGETAILVAKPIIAKDGNFVGVNALYRPVKSMLQRLRFTENWFGEASELLVALEPESGPTQGGLRILAALESNTSDGPWAKLQPHHILQPDTPAETRLLLQRAASGQGGALDLSLNGVRTHWIFSAASKGEPFALVLVPHSQVITRAVEAGRYIVAQNLRGLAISAALLSMTVFLVLLAAVLYSQKITLPLRQLATSAKELATGDFQSRAEIDTGDEVEDLAKVFNRLGPALAERERMASSLALAGSIQNRLLPQTPPTVSGFVIVGRSVPSDETGGDYFDFIPLEDSDHLALVVGDVSGHGIGAALLMAGARGVLRSHAPHAGLELSCLLEALNEHLCRDTAEEQFMTLFYGILNGSGRTLHWCSAGHGPLFLYRRREGTVVELGATGLPLGIILETTWEKAPTIAFGDGDLLIIGTDGIWEARNPAGEALGTEPLKSLIISQAATSAERIHASIMDLVNNFRGGSPQEDDITLIVVKAV